MRFSLLPDLPAPHPDRRQAAVAAIFGPGENGPDLLLIQRAERKGDPWSGHMAFPGGHHEREDGNLLRTALRETEEEIGWKLEEDSFRGVLPEMEPVSRAHRLWITPCVFVASSWEPTRLSAEVAAIHRYSFRRFREGEGRSDFLYDWNGTPVRLPCVRLDGAFIWGLTLRMIDTLLERETPCSG